MVQFVLYGRYAVAWRICIIKELFFLTEVLKLLKISCRLRLVLPIIDARCALLQSYLLFKLSHRRLLWLLLGRLRQCVFLRDSLDVLVVRSLIRRLLWLDLLTSYSQAAPVFLQLLLDLLELGDLVALSVGVGVEFGLLRLPYRRRPTPIDL